MGSSLQDLPTFLSMEPRTITGSYSSALSLTDDVAVSSYIISVPSDADLANPFSQLEDVLADIPLFSVGFVAFGVFTFFLVMRRINRCVTCILAKPNLNLNIRDSITLYIHMAILLAFIDSVFDLSQIIRRGSYNTTHNLHVSDVEVLIILRELCFALSFGLRFFFESLVRVRTAARYSQAAALPTVPTSSDTWVRAYSLIVLYKSSSV